MAPQHAAVDMDDVAGLRGAGPQLLDHPGVAPLRDEADVLAVGLLRHGQPKLAGQPRTSLLAMPPRGNSQPVELRPRGGEQEVALVAVGIAGAVELGAAGAVAPLDVVAGGQRARRRAPGRSPAGRGT